MPLWEASRSEAVAALVEEFDRVVVLEDHLRSGGFGAYVQESLDRTPHLLPKVSCVGLDPSICGKVASQMVLNSDGGLSIESVTSLIG